MTAIPATWLALAQATQPAAAPVRYDLTPGGWIVMVLSVGFVTGLLLWCIWRVTRESAPEKLRGPQEIDTGDLNDN